MTPTDPLYGDEWGLARINAPTAWDRVAGASGVRVAVLGSGIANHPDLSGRVVLSHDFTGSPHGAVDQSPGNGKPLGSRSNQRGSRGRRQPARLISADADGRV
jgi:hypothetical protein